MKKIYQTPSVKVFHFEKCSPLLVGSLGDPQPSSVDDPVLGSNEDIFTELGLY
ncbi:MAG: hypothetical protein K5764_04025 [Prevotella sp.]|nr:hypothetical protein [Prevotella sp.]